MREFNISRKRDRQQWINVTLATGQNTDKALERICYRLDNIPYLVSLLALLVIESTYPLY